MHDNVESFRRISNFAQPIKTRIVYASSASTYGAATEASVELHGAAPEEHATDISSKGIMDNIAMREAMATPDWTTWLALFSTFTAPVRRHKGTAGEHGLSISAKCGQRPRIFKQGEQKRRFCFDGRYCRGANILALGSAKERHLQSRLAWARSSAELVNVLNNCLGTNLSPDYIENPHAHYQNFYRSGLEQGPLRAGLCAAISARSRSSRLHGMVVSEGRR